MRDPGNPTNVLRSRAVSKTWGGAGSESEICVDCEDLVCIPKPFPSESFTSWLSRMAFVQGETVNAVLRQLESSVMVYEDLDLAFARSYRNKLPLRLGEVVGLEPARRMMSNLLLAGIDPERVLVGRGVLSEYHFCPLCLHEQVEPHFPVAWAFNAWRYCPLHDCLMEVGCPKCQKTVVLPLSLASNARKKVRQLNLAHCGACGHYLPDVEHVTLKKAQALGLTDGAMIFLKNGRAFTAALLCGRFQVCGGPVRDSIRALNETLRQGYVPGRSFVWTAEYARRGMNVGSPA